MRIFYLSNLNSLVLCFVLWAVLQTLFAVICQKLPENLFRYDNKLFRSKGFEKEGKLYDDLFKIKYWKKYLPDGAAIKKTGFRKKYLTDFSKENLNKFLIESCRAELGHLLAITPFWIFGLFLPPICILIMLIYAIAINMPCIIAQRYNRPRIVKVLKRIEGEEGQ